MNKSDILSAYNDHLKYEDGGLFILDSCVWLYHRKNLYCMKYSILPTGYKEITPEDFYTYLTNITCDIKFWNTLRTLGKITFDNTNPLYIHATKI